MFHRWWELSFVFHDHYKRLSVFGKPEANLEGCSKLQIRALVIRVWGRDSGGNLALVLGNVATAPLTPYSLGRPFCLHSHPIPSTTAVSMDLECVIASSEGGNSTHVIVQELNIAMFLQSIYTHYTTILVFLLFTDKQTNWDDVDPDSRPWSWPPERA